MSGRLKDSERTRLIAEYIRTGKSPAGYEITETEQSKYRVKRIRSKQELLEEKQARLKRQLEMVELELNEQAKAKDSDSEVASSNEHLSE